MTIILKYANEYSKNRIVKIYDSPLTFHIAALTGKIDSIKNRLKKIIEVQNKYSNLIVKRRVLDRADAYVRASKDKELVNLEKKAGYYEFGIGADGAASVEILKKMRKGDLDLKNNLLKAFKHCEENQRIPEILYIFGDKDHNKEILKKTKELCLYLLNEFSSSIYRGFPAKTWMIGNRNWTEDTSWRNSLEYKELLNNPELFISLEVTSLQNYISMPNKELRKLTNKYAVEMSFEAHKIGRVQSLLTIPPMKKDGYELMDLESFEKLKEIIGIYMPNLANGLTLGNLNDYYKEINRALPKDV